MRRSTAIGLAALLSAAATAASAQTIYPVDRAEILAGTKFDVKVEFPGSPAATAVRVTVDGKDLNGADVNGADLASVLGKESSFVEREDGEEHSAYWIRDGVLTKPGKYIVEATAGGKT